jgi:hypothetical protein
MGETTYGLLGAAIAAALAPLFWWLIAGLTLWAGRNLCNDKWGRRLFGHYWERRGQEQSLAEQAAEGSRGWVGQASYWLGKQTGRLARRK